MSSLYGQFNSFKHTFITDVSQFKTDFLCQKSTRNDQNIMEKLLHQMEKEITFLHEELKSKNTIITLLLENVVKLKDNNNENRSIHSNNDVKITQSEENNNKSTQPIEIVEREITLTEPLNIIVNDSDTRSRKSNQHYTGDKSPNLNDTITPQNKGGTNRKKTIIVGDSIAKDIEGWRLNKRMKSPVAVKSIPGATTKSMKHHIKGRLEDNSPDSVILHVGTSNLKNKESVEDIANDVMNMAIFIRNEKTNVFVSGLIVRNDRLNDKGKSVNSLLKRRCDEEKICFVDNTNINVGMLNNSRLHLNERGTTRLVNTFCFSLAK